MFVSRNPDLGLLANGREERRPLLDSLAQVLFGPHDRVEFAPEVGLELLDRLDERVDREIADHEHIDVATGVVVTARVGTEDESEPNSFFHLEQRPNLRRDSNRSRV
jgi:hypothetical protein